MKLTNCLTLTATALFTLSLMTACHTELRSVAALPVTNAPLTKAEKKQWPVGRKTGHAKNLFHQAGFFILSLKPISYCRYKYFNVYIF